MPAKTLNATVCETILVNPETMILRIAPVGWELPDYIPGQFAVLGLPGSAARIPLSDPETEAPDPDNFIVRAYSIASSSKEKEYLEFYVSLVRSGALTPRLFALKRGDQLHLGSKLRGMFTLQDIPDQVNLIMMGTGTGLAPYMSMIRTFLTHGSKRRFTVFHGARHSWDLGYRSELSTLNNILANFTYIPVISRPAEEVIPWGGQVGHLQDMWARGLVEVQWGLPPSPDNTHVFLCGNPGMVTDTLKLLEARGFREHTPKQPGQVHLERYW